MDTPATTATIGNVVDRASQSADSAIAATQRAADKVLSGVSDKMHSLRDQASPVVDKFAAPFDSVGAYTQQAPLKSLLISAALGAAAMALISLMSRSHR